MMPRWIALVTTGATIKAAGTAAEAATCTLRAHGRHVPSGYMASAPEGTYGTPLCS